MLRGSSTPSTHVYYFLHLLFIRIQMIGLRNLWKTCWRTEKFLKKAAQQMYEEEVKSRFFDLLEKSKLTYR